MRGHPLLLALMCLSCAPTPDGGPDGGPDAGPDEVPTTCGDGELQTFEECEGLELRGQTCASLGFENGSLVCGSDCVLDRNSCSTCRDGVVSGDEACDGLVAVQTSCPELGFADGVVGCAPDCTALRDTTCNASCETAACAAGTCVDDVCRMPCDSNAACFSNEKCFRGSCLPTCNADFPCLSGLPCNGDVGVCTQVVVECTQTCGCGAGQICKEGACVAAEPCNSNSDCQCFGAGSQCNGFTEQCFQP